ncbi:hypothetical protein [Microlunatus sp. Gsoil 973]|uniref:hypothetical protein n=1 Tax=Microlunatus sp. Gsoil 973 TaxID=2672569 RepID=UPI0012B486B7|nr:hypothetical protein [Microlunatus sp. Gsoil 973]QGN33749.1 hypothetical protein GJV80_14050 [Microlunatus sp. Gsoil 973]
MSNNDAPDGDGSETANASGFGRPGPDQPDFGYGGQSGQSPHPVAGAGQEQPSYGGPGQPGPQPYGPSRHYEPAGVGGSGPGNRGKLPFILGGVGLAFVLVVVLIIVAVVHTVAGGGAAEAGPAGGSSASSKAEKASDVVHGYLDALAAGDSAKALGLLSKQPSDPSLMTDEVLKASRKAAPITAIAVPEVTDKYAYQVSASYKLGDRLVDAKFSIDDSSGHYLISDGYAEIDLSYTAEGLPLTINGVKVAADKVALFPGAYVLGTTADYITLGSGADFLVQQPNDYPRIEAKPSLTAAGQRVFKEKVATAINACLASKKLKAGCGLDLPSSVDGYKFKEGTVKRTLNAESRWKIKGIKGELDYSAPTVAESDFYAYIETKVDGAKGGRTYRGLGYYGGANSFGSPKIDMSAKKLTVEWED